MVATSLSLAVAPASALSKHVFSTSFSGEGASALSHPTDVAVDQLTGDVYVVDRGNHRVEKFTPGGEFIFMVGQEVNRTASEDPAASLAEKNLCTAASGDACQPARLRPGATTSDVGPGDLANPLYLAVDNSGGIDDGDFYVASAQNESLGGHQLEQDNYLTKFDPEGYLVSDWYDNGQLRLAPGYSSFLAQYGPSVPGGKFSQSPTGIAVDAQGTLYFTTRVVFFHFPQTDVLFRLGSFGAVTSSATISSSLEGVPSLPGGHIASGPVGTLLATQPGDRAVHDIGPTGGDFGTLTGLGFDRPPTALAYDLSTEDAYVAEAGSLIRHYGPGCEPADSPCFPAETFGSPQLGGASGLAVKESTGTVYAADAEKNQVAVFSPAPDLPDVLTGEARNEPNPTDVAVSGAADPDGAGEVTACNFEYTSQPAFEADRRDELQELTLSGASGGVFDLAFEGQSTATTGTGEIEPANPNRLNSVSTSAGAFVAGEAISGEGIPSGAHIVEVKAGEDGTESLVISPAATPHGRVPLTAAIPVNQESGALPTAQVIEEALAALPTIGAQQPTVLGPKGVPNVSVSGPQGGPYTIEFTHRLGHTALPPLSADAVGLTPPGATASVETVADGGNGWATASQAPCLNEAGEDVNSHPIPGSAGRTALHAAVAGLTAETTYHLRLRAGNANGSLTGRDRPFVPHYVIGLTTDPATGLSGEAATLNGSLLGDGTDTHYYFEWGKTTAYGNESPAPPGADLPSPAGPSATPLSVEISDLEPSTTYHYRVLAKNEAGQTSLGLDREFTTPANRPTISGTFAAEVFADTAILHAQVNPGTGDTVYHAEFGTKECSAPGEPCQVTPRLAGHAGAGSSPVPAQVSLRGLQPGTLYHYRLVAENLSGQTRGVERTFTTLPTVNPAADSCANAHVRQQTSAASLPDCRAYELASAAKAGGYDVESSLIPGQSPFAGYPEADGRLLYGVHNGGIPGTDHPTNHGVDPYLAMRGKEGWSTQYVGVPADDPFAVGPFSSTPSGADSGLQTFAFGAPEGCSPCFGPGTGVETGIPVRLPNGELVQGMVAAEGVPTPPASAEPAGKVAKDLSADGSHLIFGSTSKFTSDGNEGGDLTIYDRNLKTGETHAVSKTPVGATMTGSGIAELGLSANGSHVLIGQQVAEDAAHNSYYHLYMDIGDATHSIDLTPDTTSGVLYAGMSADGSKVFFTTKDQQLLGEDEDQSADLYMAEVSGQTATLELISTNSDGTPDNTDSCDPAANSAHQHWNSAVEGEEPNCGVVALGGGGGVSATNGTVYFLSPQQLESGKGTEDAPNLYVARPADGYAPHYVTTLESLLTGPQPPELGRAFRGNFGSSFGDATGVAVDHASGDVYVLDAAEGKVSRFDSSGDPAPFPASAPYINGNTLTGSPKGGFEEFAELNLPTQIAVGPSGLLYVPNTVAERVEVFEPSGTYVKSLEVPLPTGVAIRPGNGNVYVGSYFGIIDVFDPSGSPVEELSIGAFGTSDVAVDSGGTIYASQEGGPMKVYDSSGAFEKVLDANSSQSAAVDPATGEIYVDEGTLIARYDSSTERLGAVGNGVLSGSVGVTVDAGGNLYASNLTGTKIAAFGHLELAPRADTDNPLVIDSVSAPATRRAADFQTAPSGEQAVFSSTLPLAANGEETAGHAEVYRYAAQAEKISCISCSPGGAPSTGDSSLGSNGLSLTDDGRVFFNSNDHLSGADTDGKQDVYEWEAPGTGTCQSASLTFNNAIGACLGLISAGTSPSDSGLLSTTADGKDAFFFTRDSLAPQDENGPTMKIYDAREGGGFPFLLPEEGCKASDECHGAASPTPPPIQAGSEAGTPHNFVGKTKSCKKGYVKKRSHCVKRSKPRKHHRRADHKRGPRR